MIHDNTAIDVVLFVAILLPSIILHEVAHGWLADRFGDPTARLAGRLTLNPIPHIDPVGSLLLPGLLAVAGQNVFGWAKPVPVNPAAFRRPNEQMALVGLAGPGTNLALAVLAARLGPFVDGSRLSQSVVWYPSLEVGITTGAMWGRVVFGILVVNVALAVFNMLPIPPLDGSRLLPLVLPEQARVAYMKISQYGFLILFALVFIFEGSLSFIGDVIGWLMRVLV